MKKNRCHSLIGGGFIILFGLNLSLIISGLITDHNWFIIVALILSFVQFVLHDIFFRKHSIIKNYPVKAKLKSTLGKLSPRIAKSLLGNRFLKAILTGHQYEIILRRSKNISTEIVRNTLAYPNDPDFECISYIDHKVSEEIKLNDLMIEIGSVQCSQPYKMSVLNIGALNQKELKNSAVLAISEGANIQRCAVNTGRGGISSSLIRGGSDLIWQIAHEDYAFRNENCSFNEQLFQVTATRPYVKMIEVSLPRNEALIKKRLLGGNLITFLNKLRVLSEGKPIGVRLFNPGKEVIAGICELMLTTGVVIDFITIDGTALAGFDAVAEESEITSEYFRALSLTRKTIDSYGLPTKIITAERIITEYDILRAIALGANACYSTIPLILAAGTQPWYKLRDSTSQRLRVANFHRNTLAATLRLMKLCGYQTLQNVKASDFYRKTDFYEIKSLKEIYFDEQEMKSSKIVTGLN